MVMQCVAPPQMVHGIVVTVFREWLGQSWINRFAQLRRTADWTNPKSCQWFTGKHTPIYFI